MFRVASRLVVGVAALLVAACGGRTAPDGGAPDASTEDAGTVDSGLTDAGIDGGGPVDSGLTDAGSPDAGADAGVACSVNGEPGQCEDVTVCGAMAGYRSTPGLCPGPAAIQCCTRTPNVADNPPVPTGWKLMMQSQVTPAMTTWAVAILNDPTGYPLFSTTTMVFGGLNVLARVEWHPPDFQNSVVHRGVTLYVPV